MGCRYFNKRLKRAVKSDKRDTAVMLIVAYWSASERSRVYLSLEPHSTV